MRGLRLHKTRIPTRYSLDCRHGPHDQETCLVEAFNLRAAIEHTRKNYEMAVEALSDMPPRREQELDPVTLHNQACLDEVAAFRLEALSRTMLGIALHTPLSAWHMMVPLDRYTGSLNVGSPCFPICFNSRLLAFRPFCTWRTTQQQAFASLISCFPTRPSHQRHSAIYSCCTASMAITNSPQTSWQKTGNFHRTEAQLLRVI